jgi:hypothetical protein
MAAELIAVSALVVSFASFLLNIGARRRAIMPLLVFLERTGAELTFKNVGNGPAINIIYAQGRATTRSPGSISLSYAGHEHWFNPIHLRPLAPGDAETLAWDTGDDLGIRYTDALGMDYTVKANADGTGVLMGMHLPAPSRLEHEGREVPLRTGAGGRKAQGASLGSAPP